VTCNAEFLFRNTGSDTVNLIVHTAWDNNAMQSSKWATYQVQPGNEWAGHVDRTNYTSGVVTYSKVDRILVIRDMPECISMLVDASQPKWEVQALYIDEFTCR